MSHVDSVGWDQWLDGWFGWLVSGRGLALVSGGLVSVAYLSVLHSVLVIVGELDPLIYLAEIVVVLGVTVVVSRMVSFRGAIGIGVGLAIIGYAGYLVVLPPGLVDVTSMLGDVVSFFTGLSVLQIIRAEVWVVGFTPGPVFVSWYCFLRRRYVIGAVVAGSTVVFLLLTGDMSVLLGAIGAVGVMGVIGFGRIDRYEGSAVQRDTVVSVLVVVALVTMTVSFVPGGQAAAIVGPDGSGTVEQSLFSAPDEVEITGSVELSPAVRFTVTTPESSYWRASAYDRYTGSGWVRTGRTSAYSGSLDGPVSSETTRVSQSYQMAADLGVMPAAWKPVVVTEGSQGVRVTSLGGLRPVGRLSNGDRYSVTSEIPEPSVLSLRSAGTEYPSAVVSRYTQLPDSTPASIDRFTAQVTRDATTPYDATVTVRDWLLESKAYSLDVEQPDGDIASGFLFEMDAGYCTYFATAMVAMLRSQDIPARFVTGYSTGQQVGENTWVARGFNSHAWVEVYFPNHGWIAFDPTPSGPREAVRSDRLSTARAGSTAGVDTALSSGVSYQSGAEGTSVSGGVSPRPSDSDQETAPTPTGQARNNSTAPVEQPGFTPIGERALDPSEFRTGGGIGDGLPSGDVLWFLGVVGLGLGIGVYRFGFWDWGKTAVWVRRIPGGSAEDRVIGVFERIEYVLAREYRPRRPGESRRVYLNSLGSMGVDERVREVYGVFEQAYYGGGVSGSDAADCVRIARTYLGDHVWWYWAR